MKALKIALVIALVYAGVVASFESLLGYFQPAGQGTLVISTTDAQGQSSEGSCRRLSTRASCMLRRIIGRDLGIGKCWQGQMCG